jgi:IS1 family transposase
LSIANIAIDVKKLIAMNKLSISKKVQITNLLVEGMSMRATSRVADVSINTVTKLLVDVGTACQTVHDENVHGLTTKRIQVDEIWSFVYAKEKNVPEIVNTEISKDKAGDVWTWVGIDADTKLVVSWCVGDRTIVEGKAIMEDIKSKVKNRLQITTDELHTYLEAIGRTFGTNVDYAQPKKIYGTPEGNASERRYSPAQCTNIEVKRISVKPDAKHISTSYIERQNLTMRMHKRWFTRLTNGFSKKIENHCHAIAVHYVYYNFVKIHTTLRVTPAMEAGLTKDLMSIEDIVRLAD